MKLFVIHAYTGPGVARFTRNFHNNRAATSWALECFNDGDFDRVVLTPDKSKAVIAEFNKEKESAS